MFAATAGVLPSGCLQLLHAVVALLRRLERLLAQLKSVLHGM